MRLKKNWKLWLLEGGGHKKITKEGAQGGCLKRRGGYPNAHCELIKTELSPIKKLKENSVSGTCHYWLQSASLRKLYFTKCTYYVLHNFKDLNHILGFPMVVVVVGGGGGHGGAPPSSNFFRNPHPHQNRCPPWGTPSPVKNEAPHLKSKPPPLKREASFHEMILGKSTIYNNLKSS